jgi:hypothetical protein
MSEISRGLLAQQAADEAPDVGKVIKKLLGAQTAVVNAEDEKKRFDAEQQKLAEIAELRANGWDY